MKFLRSALFAVAAVYAVFLTGCGANIFSTQQEISMGENFAREIESQSDILNDEEWNEYIDDIGQRIAAVCDRPDLTYHFSIIEDDSTVNAFAVPGGFIYIYTGLILRAENEAEIAGVLAHEVGHVVGKHSMKRLTQVYGLQFALSIALGQNPNQLASLGAEFLAGGLIMNYGRDNEFESDYYGVKYIHMLGYDPNGFKTFLEKLAAMHGDADESNLLEKMMSTHPDPNDRVARAEQIIAELPENEKRLNEERFLMMKEKLRF
ncbi:M48 family metallopeptidase [candidate division KSB1 bacterium]